MHGSLLLERRDRPQELYQEKLPADVLEQTGEQGKDSPAREPAGDYHPAV
ncbi:hypothetical protein [Lacipirellula limnantheis]|nr:hypothetical protein [Lacipirellula limnantheis]